MDIERLSEAVRGTWHDSILEKLIEYVRIPNKSPMFDPQWERNGHMDAAIELLAQWCREQPVPGLRVDLVKMRFLALRSRREQLYRASHERQA